MRAGTITVVKAVKCGQRREECGRWTVVAVQMTQGCVNVCWVALRYDALVTVTELVYRTIRTEQLFCGWVPHKGRRGAP